MALNRIIGNAIDADINTDDSISVNITTLDGSDFVSTALGTRPEIKIREREVDISNLNISLTKSPYLPSIGVGAVGTWGTPGDALSTDPDLNYQVLAYLDLPLIYFGKKGKEVEASRLRTQIANYQLEKTRDLISLEVSQARYALEESIRKVELTQNSVVQADDNLDLITDRFNEGLSPIIEVLYAQLFWESAYSDFVRAKNGYQNNYAIYLRALGQNLDGLTGNTGQ
jgi:outer membrane protein TolC